MQNFYTGIKRVVLEVLLDGKFWTIIDRNTFATPTGIPQISPNNGIKARANIFPWQDQISNPPGLCRWGSKSFEPSSRSGGFGDRDRGGFGDRDRLSDRSRDRDGDISRADTEDKWSRRAPVSGDVHS